MVFDIGRVIVRVNYDRAVRTLSAGTPHSGEHLWRLIQAEPRLRDFQEGRMTPRQWHAHLALRLSLNLSFEEFCAAWNSALDPQPMIPGEVFAELAGRFRLGLLSNTDPLHVEHMESQFDFPRFFLSRIYSCAVGLSKPHPAIYRRAIEAAGAEPQEILYVDDVAEYVEAGRRAGLQVILFEGAESLTAELRRRSALK
jgi:FMN phosphatase YigB (HAD superfamily)